MTFTDSTSSFFDELSRILQEKQAIKEQAMDLKNDRPFSSLLTQDEEPDEDYHNTYAPMGEEPEVIMRPWGL